MEVLMNITTFDDKIMPKEPSELVNSTWITNKYTENIYSDSLTFETRVPEFCI